jgi:hypothetical protein
LGEPPALAFYCPTCALQEFGPPRRRRLDEEQTGWTSPLLRANPVCILRRRAMFHA